MIREYLERFKCRGEVAVEATGNWYWIVEEIEKAGCMPLLVHPKKAKMMMAMTNKTDKLDVHGLNVLQRNGTLPTVWIPDSQLRDLRELTRTRIVLTRTRTKLKNRINSTMSKYGLMIRNSSDPFGKKGRQELESLMGRLPPNTHEVTRMLLDQLDFVEGQIKGLESQLKELVKMTRQMELLMSLPGVGVILSATIVLEIGDIGRFLSAERLASYSGTTPRVHASGGKVRYGTLRPDTNRYLKWAFVEAGNSVAVNHKRMRSRHVSTLYERIRKRKGHAKAVGAVARHLAEAAFHVLSKGEPYLDPALKKGESREA